MRLLAPPSADGNGLVTLPVNARMYGAPPAVVGNSSGCASSGVSTTVRGRKAPKRASFSKLGRITLVSAALYCVVSVGSGLPGTVGKFCGKATLKLLYAW